MKSMTGFGTGDAPLGFGKVAVEARSVNHRYLDVRVRLPPELVDRSLFLEQRAREKLSRGRLDVSVRYEGPPARATRLDLERARAAYRDLAALRDELAPGTELPITAVVGLPDVFVATPAFGVDSADGALAAALDQAIGHLELMRAEEGIARKRELVLRLGTCRTLHARVVDRSVDAVKSAEARLRTRVSRITSQAGVSLDPGRLEGEIALLADRSDITEELVRLDSHFAQAETLFEAGDPCGRRLDFLIQEMAREANTIGAKSQDAELGHLVVELKSEIERMREQVQNVE
jgi:uncharacterized protein (TIGR00255 family)